MCTALCSHIVIGHLLRLSFRFLDQKLYDAVDATDLLTIEDFIVSKMKLATCG